MIKIINSNRIQTNRHSSPQLPLQRLEKRAGGFSFAEIAASVVFIIFMTIMAIDVWLLIVAVPINDSACRDGARAAAQGSDSITAGNLAAAAVASHASQSSIFISQPQITHFVYQDFGGAVPAGNSPFVSVTTQCQVKPIIPLSAFGTLIIGNQTFTFQQIYTFPIIKTKGTLQ